MVIRAAILTKEYAAGDKLPAQSELAKHFGVARMTVQQALRVLKEEGLTVSRQGSGVFVRERNLKPVELRSFLERSFEASTVRIDFLGYTAETLHNAIAEPLDKIRAGRLTPTTIRLRLLLPDLDSLLALPVLASGAPSQSQDVRDRMREISERHINEMRKSIEELAELRLVKDASVEVKVIASSPLTKTYIINGDDVFFGYYPVRQHAVTIEGSKVEIFDPMGKDATMFHFNHDGDVESNDSILVENTREWFESLWTTIATSPLRNR